MPTPTFNIGRDAVVVTNGPFGQLELNTTEFQWADNTHEVMSRPVNGKTQIAYIPDYVSGRFEVDRNSSVLEGLISKSKAAFYNGGSIPVGSLFAYITEITGSITTLQFNNVVFRLSNGGQYKQDDAVKQTLEFAASDYVML